MSPINFTNIKFGHHLKSNSFEEAMSYAVDWAKGKRVGYYSTPTPVDRFHVVTENELKQAIKEGLDVIVLHKPRTRKPAQSPSR